MEKYPYKFFARDNVGRPWELYRVPRRKKNSGSTLIAAECVREKP